MATTIRPYRQNDCAALLAIYNHEISHGSATFEETPLSLAVFSKRLAGIQAEFPVLVLEHQDSVVGYAYGTHYKPRSAYRFSAEVTIYLAPSYHGKGLAKRLYQELFIQLKQQGIRQLLAVVTHPNIASEGFHQHLGFKQVGLLERVGFKFDRWYDVALYQRELI